MASGMLPSLSACLGLIFFALLLKMLWHIKIFGFGVLGVIFCRLYAGLLMIPKTKNTKLLYSQSQQVAALRCSNAEQVLEARLDCAVTVHAPALK